MVVRIILKLWLLVREWNKGNNSNLVSALAYLDTGKYPAWICGYLTGGDESLPSSHLQSPTAAPTSMLVALSKLVSHAY
jgi:hypothetical protein